MMKNSIKAGIIGGLGGLVVSFAVNYFVVPMPQTILGNAIGNGTSGLLSGFIGGFLGLLVYMRSLQKAQA